MGVAGPTHPTTGAHGSKGGELAGRCVGIAEALTTLYKHPVPHYKYAIRGGR
jgi:hypothetical protein